MDNLFDLTTQSLRLKINEISSDDLDGNEKILMHGLLDFYEICKQESKSQFWQFGYSLIKNMAPNINLARPSKTIIQFSCDYGCQVVNAEEKLLLQCDEQKFIFKTDRKVYLSPLFIKEISYNHCEGEVIIHFFNESALPLRELNKISCFQDFDFAGTFLFHLLKDKDKIELISLGNESRFVDDFIQLELENKHDNILDLWMDYSVIPERYHMVYFDFSRLNNDLEGQEFSIKLPISKNSLFFNLRKEHFKLHSVLATNQYEINCEPVHSDGQKTFLPVTADIQNEKYIHHIVHAFGVDGYGEDFRYQLIESKKHTEHTGSLIELIEIEKDQFFLRISGKDSFSQQTIHIKSIVSDLPLENKQLQPQKILVDDANYQAVNLIETKPAFYPSIKEWRRLLPFVNLNIDSLCSLDFLNRLINLIDIKNQFKEKSAAIISIDKDVSTVVLKGVVRSVLLINLLVEDKVRDDDLVFFFLLYKLYLNVIPIGYDFIFKVLLFRNRDLLHGFSTIK